MVRGSHFVVELAEKIMDSFLPSEIGRLIYGYLISECDQELGESFLSTSKVMEECRLMKQIRGRKFSSKVQELSLTDILEQYSAVCSMVFKHTQKNECVHRNVPALLESILNARKKVRGANNSLRAADNATATAARENVLELTTAENTPTVEEIFSSTPSTVRTADENCTNVSAARNDEPMMVEETVASPARVEPLSSEQCATSSEVDSYTSPMVTADVGSCDIFSPTNCAAVTTEEAVHCTNNSAPENEQPVCVVKLTDIARRSERPVDTAKSKPIIAELSNVPRREDPAPATSNSKPNNVCKKLRPKSDRLKARTCKPTADASLKRILPKPPAPPPPPPERTLRNRIANTEMLISCGKTTELPAAFDKKEITNSPLNSLTVSPKSRLSNNSTPSKEAAKASILADNDLETTKANGNNKSAKEPWDLKLRKFLAQEAEPPEPHKTPRKSPRKCKRERNHKNVKEQNAKKRKLEETNANEPDEEAEKDQVCEVPTSADAVAAAAAAAADKVNSLLTNNGKNDPSESGGLCSLAQKEKILEPSPLKTNRKPSQVSDGVCDLAAENIPNVVENITFTEADLSKSSCSDSVASTNLQVELCLEDEIVLFYKISTVR